MPLIDENMDDYNEPTAPPDGRHDVKIATARLGKSWDDPQAPYPPRPQINIGLLLQDDPGEYSMQWLRLTFTQRGDDRHADNMLNIKRASAAFDIPLAVFTKPEEEFVEADFVGATASEVRYKTVESKREAGRFNTYINLPQLED